MIAHQHEAAAGSRHAHSFAIDRTQIRQVLVGKQLGHQAIGRSRQVDGGDVTQQEPIVEASGGRALQHGGREVDAIDRRDALGLQPGAAASSAARQVERPSGIGPVDALQPLEQPQVHEIEDGRLVGVRPGLVPLANRQGRGVAGIEAGKLDHRHQPSAAVAERGGSAAPRLGTRPVPVS